MRSYHDSPFAGHLGVQKTEAHLREKFFWPGLRLDVRKWIQCCDSCAGRKDPVPNQPAPLQPIPGLAKFERWQTDCLGPLPLTEKGNKFILLFVECFSRFVELIPVPDLKAETTGRAFLEHIVLRYGVPTQILSDRGTNYTSELLKGVYDLLGVKPLFTTPLHPQGNGLSERMNKSLLDVLSHYVNTKTQKDWDIVLPYVAFAMRTALSKSLRETSFFLMYLTDPVMPLESILDLPKSRYRDIEDFKMQMQVLFQDATEAAHQALTQAQQQQNTSMIKTLGNLTSKLGISNWGSRPLSWRH